MWERLRSLIIKELLAVWRDKKSRFVLIGPPIIQLLLFSYAATFDVTHYTIAIYNEDSGLASRQLVARFSALRDLRRVIVLHRDSDIAPTIDSREAVMVVHIGPDFSARLESGRPATVQTILDGRMSNTAQIVQGYANNIVKNFNLAWAKDHGAPPPTSTLVTRAWFNPNLLSQWVIVPELVGLLTMVVSLVVTALSIARERELGTFDQLLVTPLRPWEILLGKTVPALLVGLFEGTLIVVAARLWFRVPLTGSLALLYFSLFVFLLAAIGVGLFISALAVTQQQAILGAFLFLVPAVTLSGFATPIDNMPQWLQFLTLANPLRHFLVIVQGVFLKDAPFGLLWESLRYLVGIAALTLAGATWLSRHRLG